MQNRSPFTIIATLLLTLTVAGTARGQTNRVALVQVEGGWQLRVDGKPFVIKGAAGNGSKAMLKRYGGNSFRTWGIDGNTKAILDEAHKLGMMVTVGFWVGHERHGFDYGDVEQVANQYESFKKAVETFKDHPAVLCWAIGNEMEAGAKQPAAIWSAINNMAALAKKLDPTRPTMTVVADLGPNNQNVTAIQRLCPEIDIVGLNSYGGGPSIAKRYRAAGGTKPFAITEFGTLGQWEVEKTDFGSSIEMTSTQKAKWYLKTYKAAHADPMCLGSYAFTWGHKVEATTSWHGMLLPDGSKLAAVDVLSEQWTGKKPVNLCPAINKLEATTAVQAKTGTEVKIALKVSDPENDKLEVKWVLRNDSQNYVTGGDAQEDPGLVKGAISDANSIGATITMPKNGGAYRIYAYVRDGKGGAAVGNVPLFVDAPVKALPAQQVKLPFVIYDDDGKAFPYSPSGWMGKADAIAMTPKWADKPRSGKTCIRVDYKQAAGWGGVVWQHPEGDWGDRAGGFNLSGATKLTFWARGAAGNEKVKFGLGVLDRTKKYYDTTKAEVEIELTTEWKQYKIDLAERDLTRIKTGFLWVVAGQGKPITFFLDDIQYEK
jgi:hypothetical protein